MGKLAELTNSLTRSSDQRSSGIFHFNVPETSIGGLLPITREREVTSIGELAESVSDTMANINLIAHMAYCIGELITHPDMLLNILDIVTNHVMAVAVDVASRLASIIGGQILGAFSTIAGTIVNLVNSILDFLTSLVKLYETLLAIWDNIKNRSKGNWDGFMSKEDCEFMFACIVMCILNKLYGEKLKKFEQNVTQKIVKFGQDVNSALTEELTDVNALGNYLKHESLLVDKANAQLQIFA